jgi:hypothetical protein
MRNAHSRLLGSMWIFRILPNLKELVSMTTFTPASSGMRAICGGGGIGRVGTPFASSVTILMSAITRSGRFYEMAATLSSFFSPLVEKPTAKSSTPLQ